MFKIKTQYFQNNRNKKKQNSKQPIKRERAVDMFNRKIIIYSGISIFESYVVFMNPFDKTLELKCKYSGYGERDEFENRSIKLTRKLALYLIKDLIKFVITRRV